MTTGKTRVVTEVIFLCKEFMILFLIYLPCGTEMWLLERLNAQILKLCYNWINSFWYTAV
jgi:hypothetical protein